MGKAEVGTSKYIAKKMKQKGLTRLRWYCQICQKANRDENAFKMHCQSEGHLRRALEAGENFKSVQDEYSRLFLQQFISQLKTAHGEKQIHANKFYQEVIANRDHIHLNATRWHSLTDFVKYIAREGIVRAEEKEDGLFIAWIDDSPEAMKRREAVRKKELQDKGDEEREQMILRQQIERAQKDAEARGVKLTEDEAKMELKRQEGEKIKLSLKPLGKGTGSSSEGSSAAACSGANPALEVRKEGEAAAAADAKANGETPKEGEAKPAEQPAPAASAAAKPVSLKIAAKPAPKNVFKNALAGAPKKVITAPPPKMSEAERIMKEELERKRAREEGRGAPSKKPRF